MSLFPLLAATGDEDIKPFKKRKSDEDGPKITSEGIRLSCSVRGYGLIEF